VSGDGTAWWNICFPTIALLRGQFLEIEPTARRQRQSRMMLDRAARPASRWFCNGMVSIETRRSGHRVLQSADRLLTGLTVKGRRARLPGYGKLPKSAQNFDCKSLSRDLR